jgi:hypothetical protein
MQRDAFKGFALFFRPAYGRLTAGSYSAGGSIAQ